MSEPDISTAMAMAKALLARGDLAAAEARVLELHGRWPQEGTVVHLLAVVHAMRGDLPSALEGFERVIALRPAWADGWVGLGRVQVSLGRWPEALAAFDRAIELQFGHPDARFQRGNLYVRLRDHARAVLDFEHILEQDQASPAVWNNRGNALIEMGRQAEGTESLERAVALKPDWPEAWRNLAAALATLGRHDAAIRALGRLIALRPTDVEAIIKRAQLLRELGRQTDALASLETPTSALGDHADLWAERGVNLWQLGRTTEAASCYREANQIAPRNAEILVSLAALERLLGNLEGAYSCLTEASRLDPTRPFLPGNLRLLKDLVVGWADRDTDLEQLEHRAHAGEPVAGPLPMVQLIDDPALQRRAAEFWVRKTIRATPTITRPTAVGRPRRLRIAYVSHDFREHPVSHLIAELFETHDRQRFECFAVSTGPADSSAIRTRISRGIEHFDEIGNADDQALVAHLRELDIDIAVDLTGHTQGRFPVLACRPARIQVSYLGYPATTGAPFIDYLIVDRFVVPPGAEAHYSEALVFLPGSFQVNDSRRAISAPSPSRASQGLPEEGFIFACFNQAHKLSPDVFRLWLRLLAQIPGSVLWLGRTAERTQSHLRREAQVQGIGEERVIFARFESEMADHLARLRLADLCLDTLPYNGHSTASDALWSGVPMLSCAGHSYAARVGGSLLTAMGLPELIAYALDDYETAALRLARNPGELSALRSKLATLRRSCGLFDGDRFRRHLEAAFDKMWDRYVAGQDCASFEVLPTEACQSESLYVRGCAPL
jgi:predicted O-linked N-acetylglucosamine transferase (SPINDLY family)